MLRRAAFDGLRRRDGEEERLHGAERRPGIFASITGATGRDDVGCGMGATFRERREMVHFKAFHFPVTIGAAMIIGGFNFVPLCSGEVGNGGVAFAGATTGAKLGNLFRIAWLLLDVKHYRICCLLDVLVCDLSSIYAYSLRSFLYFAVGIPFDVF